MDARSRRIVGPLVLALVFLQWSYGFARWLTEPGGIAIAAAALAVVWLIGYRAWPACEMVWDFFASPAAKRAYRPTGTHLLGAAGISIAIHLLVVAMLLTMSTRLTVEWNELAKSLLVFGIAGYVVWPAIVVKWRHWRGHRPAPR